MNECTERSEGMPAKNGMTECTERSEGQREV
jgi:hypothetical protein